jgi:hypothetical protein
MFEGYSHAGPSRLSGLERKLVLTGGWTVRGRGSRVFTRKLIQGVDSSEPRACLQRDQASEDSGFSSDFPIGSRMQKTAP